MKTIIFILSGIIIFFGFYIIFSFIGQSLFAPDNTTIIQITANPGWFFMYTFLLGWWLTALPMMELYTNLNLKDIHG